MPTNGPAIDPPLQNALRRAFEEALSLRHEYVTLEHLLLGLLDEPTSAAFFRTCRADLGAIRSALYSFLETHVEKVPGHIDFDVNQTLVVRRVLQQAAIHAVTSDLDTIRGEAVLRQMFNEEESYAVYLMRDAGVRPADLDPNDRKQHHHDAPPQQRRRLYVSYTWNDVQPDGLPSDELVRQLCQTMSRKGVAIIRDTNSLRYGERISSFMSDLADGDLIVVVLSDKYLRSHFCMYELNEVFRRCGRDPDRFQKRVIPLIQPDARLHRTRDQLAYVKYWVDEREDLKLELDKLGADNFGPTLLRKRHMLNDFASQTSEILALITDVLMPRDLPTLARNGFQELLPLLGFAETKRKDF